MMTVEHDVAPLSYWRNGLLLALLVWLLTWLLYTQTFDSGLRASDLRTAVDAARLLRDGQSEYAAPPGEVRYVYPPLIAMVLGPITRLPLQEAAHLWFFVCMVSLV